MSLRHIFQVAPWSAAGWTSLLRVLVIAGSYFVLAKGALKQWLGDRKADEVVVLLRRVAIARNFDNIEAELGLQMRGWVVVIGHDVAELIAKFWVFLPGGQIHCRVAVIVGGVVSERSESKGQLINVA